MGLLTDPATGQGKPTRLLVKYHNPLCILLYFASLVWFALLAHTHFNAGTYFSENAMLPGLVKGEFELDSEAKTLLSELEAEATQHSDSIPAAWLLAKFTQLNLLAFSHNFTLNYPLGRGTKFSGRNVYAILRAPRSSSMESLVLSVPYRPPSSPHLTTLPGVALMISLAKFARRQKYWAKDIIFLVTEHEQLGAQAWLEAYHGASCGQPGVLEPGDILGRGGSIQAALNLEVHASLVGHIDIKVCGLNGQLPNLDLVNLVHRMCAKEGVRHTFNKKEKIQNRDQFTAWLRSLETLAAMVTTQASGVPDGNHGLFHRFGIESVTLEGFEKRGRGSPATFYQLGRVLEGLFRSLNNLLERFHQSYFFYLLPDTDRYISIGLYMPCLGMLAGALFIKAFALWLKVQISKKESSDGYDTAAVLPEVIVDPNLNIVAVGVVMLVAHSVGVGLLYAAQLFTKITVLSTDAALFYGLLASSAITVVTPLIINIVYKIGDNWVVLNVLALLELGTVLLAVAMHNFSLAFVTAIILVPPALWIQPSNNRWFKKLIWVLIHPFLLLFCAVLLSTKFNFPDAGIGELLMRALSANSQALMLSVVDAMIYGSWSFRVAVGLMLPNWLSFWFVCQSSKPKLAMLKVSIEKAKKDN